jgi:hypothetical protein
MIKLKQCTTNPHHWYSAHNPDCPWCRALLENKSDSFPGPLIDYPATRLPVGETVIRSTEDQILPATPRIPVARNPSSRHWIPIGAIVAIGLIIIIAGVFSNGSSAASPVLDNHVSVTPSPATPAPTPTYQQTRTVSATIKKFVLKAGDDVSFEGVVSGTTDPVTVTVYSLKDTSVIEFNQPLLSAIVTPSSDSTFKYSFSADPKYFPAGSYIIQIKLPTGEWTKLQFLVDE